MNSKQREEALEKLCKHIDNERKRQITIGLVLCLIAVVVMLLPFADALYCGIGVAVIAIPYFIYSIAMTPSYRHPVILALKYSPEKITSFYIKDFKQDIALFHIPLGTKKETRLVVRYMNKKKYNLPVKDDWYTIRELISGKI